MVNEMLDLRYEKVYFIGCSFSFEAYAKNVEEKGD